MSADSVETDAQTDLANILKAIGLPGMDNAQVGVVMELPQVVEVLDPLPRVIICPRGSPAPEGLSFEGAVGRTYVEEIIVVAGREGDSQSDQPQTQAWYHACYDAVERQADGSWRTTLPTATTVYDLRVKDQLPNFERARLQSNYAYLSFFVTVHSAE